MICVCVDSHWYPYNRQNNGGNQTSISICPLISVVGDTVLSKLPWFHQILLSICFPCLPYVFQYLSSLCYPMFLTSCTYWILELHMFRCLSDVCLHMHIIAHLSTLSHHIPHVYIYTLTHLTTTFQIEKMIRKHKKKSCGLRSRVNLFWLRDGQSIGLLAEITMTITVSWKLNDFVSIQCFSP